jgi:hypothetical protein
MGLYENLEISTLIKNQQSKIMRYFITSFLLSILLTSCNNNTANRLSVDKETVDNNFNNFIEKFSTDTGFQLSRIKFPLKTRWYDLGNDEDSLIYKDKSGFEMIDLSKKSTGQHEQWEQKIVVGKNNTSVKVEIRGIENGITVDYLFKKINGAWMLIEIDDSST